MAGSQSSVDFSGVPPAAGVNPERFASTTLRNGSCPGSLLRFKQGRRAMVDVFNDTDMPEQVHWLGQYLAHSVDGTFEERAPPVPAHGHRREVLTPTPAGLRHDHTHVRADSDLTRGLNTGQARPVHMDTAYDPGACNREVAMPVQSRMRARTGSNGIPGYSKDRASRQRGVALWCSEQRRSSVCGDEYKAPAAAERNAIADSAKAAHVDSATAQLEPSRNQQASAGCLRGQARSCGSATVGQALG
ncbi:MAG: multicopper oxidase domain-containing protein, partial [Rhodanobacter sp.]